jgi:hypothetical protein
MWSRRLRDLTAEGSLPRRRAAEAGAKAAEHLLRMAVRAVDYLPPVDVEFGDFLDALLVADETVAPNDSRGYRRSIRQAFGAFGIAPSEPRVLDLADEPPTYLHLNSAALRSDPNEVARFIWQNAEALGIPREYPLLVNAVRPSVRVGPDGLVVNEVVADYVQALSMTRFRAARKLPGLALPRGLDPRREVRLWGGGTLTFDQFGAVRLHVRKPLDDWDRQSRRLAYLWRPRRSRRRSRELRIRSAAPARPVARGEPRAQRGIG